MNKIKTNDTWSYKHVLAYTWYIYIYIYAGNRNTLRGRGACSRAFIGRRANALFDTCLITREETNKIKKLPSTAHVAVHPGLVTVPTRFQDAVVHGYD